LSVFYIGSWYGIVEDIYKGHSGNYCVLPFPSSTEKPSSYGGGSVLAVSSKSKEKAEAWRLVEFILSDEFISKWSNESGDVSAFEDEFWQKKSSDQRVKLMYQQTLNSKVFPAHPAWITIENQIIKGLGHTIIELFKKRDVTINKELYTLLKKIDRKIQEIIKMSWEVR